MSSTDADQVCANCGKAAVDDVKLKKQEKKNLGRSTKKHANKERPK